MFSSRLRDAFAWLAFCCCFAFPVQAIPGTLDLSFGAPASGGGNKGWNLANFGGGDYGRRIALQSDGAIVVAGGCQTPVLFDFCLTRFTAAGLLDTSFGTAGFVVTQLSVGDDFLASMMLQSDGKIVVAGSCDAGRRAFCAARYSSNGALDSTFANSGVFIQTIGSGNSAAQAVAIASTGQIVLAGSCEIAPNYRSFCALRLNSDGSIDTAGFGTNGVFIVPPIGVASDNLASIALQSDGKIVMAGYCSNGSVQNFCLARITASGTLDSSFQGAGKFFETDSLPSFATDVKLQSDGKIVVAGYCLPASFGYDFCVRRYTATGQPDLNNFGSAGRAEIAVTNAEDFAAELAIEPNGKIVVVGRCRNPVNSPADYDFCLVRLTANGMLDSTFANGGRIARNISGFSDNASSLALQPDGKILVGGNCSGSADQDFCLARFLGDLQSVCKLDIDGDGAVLAGTDGVLHARIASGFTDGALVDGISFPSNATRTSASSISTYLQSTCNGCEIDVDGDGVLRLGIDSLILIRAALLLPGSQVMAGIALPPTATRQNWQTIRAHLNGDCGMNALP
jgi:uncharacterized delta-60 repeat protein